MKFAHAKYIYSKPFGNPRHHWEIVCPKAALHFHVSIVEGYDENAGLEIHHFYPPEYLKDNAPSQLDCKLTGGKCWHDGTTLYATVDLWPLIQGYLKIGEHDKIFEILHKEYESRFQPTPPD